MPESFLKNQNSWISIDSIHQEIIDVRDRVYNPLGYKCSQPVMETESIEYGACKFELNNTVFKKEQGVFKIK